MFCGGKKGSVEELKVSDDIDKSLRQDQRRRKKDIQILLLGAGECGKSTIFKQLKILQDNGKWTENELIEFRNSIFVNVTTQMQVLLAAAEQFNADLLPDNIEPAIRIKEYQSLSDAWTKTIGEDCAKVWSDPAIKTIYERRDKDFQLNDSAKYFFDSLERISLPNYLPTPQDALRSRVMTKGIVEADVVFEDISMKVVDVGGQRSQRRKWIHCFDGVSAVIFVAALSEYDQRCREANVNRLDESLKLFSEIVNSQWFTETPIILFLNKKDLLIEKLQRVPFSRYDPSYTGDNSSGDVSSNIKKRFYSLMKNNSNLYCHMTIAIDTQNIDFVFKAVKEILLRETINEF
ncbi:hypothetical protein SAMD00019534_015020 [Acytostelium subglobosum LB1]|uniref:hypothetical protein n=1 Tax=Acytostelium subglobosum LB1 TaxID=1410327 RepID=UPI000644DBD3|nr:hypothetical protein SAMD00019534_015020 [Acytostelium subglobosum LB1]GAM18327.1 hypothetical protein SAMD00019534_015020 [Acytostelium subglobosum LB1]|eukprot:XP_012757547.1 hypothetical protein SAMD00019534_015020 [Acytostelium subglobosum LB1]